MTMNSELSAMSDVELVRAYLDLSKGKFILSSPRARWLIRNCEWRHLIDRQGTITHKAKFALDAANDV